MDNKQKCECVIGMINDYEHTDIITFAELKEKIERDKRIAKSNEEGGWLQSKCNKYTLDDYCDKRKSTDLTRFNYCPFCGNEIDWKAIKGGANG